jgi:hypothetical protein
MRTLIQTVLLFIGLQHLTTTLLTFFAPQWFFQYIAHFPPFNEHLLADIGAFNAPIGVGLLFAAFAPERHGLLIGLAGCANLFHTYSHLRDSHLHMPPNMPVVMGALQQGGLLFMGFVLLAIAWYIKRPTTL